MNPRKRSAIFECAMFVLAAIPFGAQAANPTFDSSGDALLKGSYFARWVGVDQVSTGTGAFQRARSLTGTFSFDGAGHYSFAGQLSMSTQSSGAPSPYNVSSGTYAVSSGGLLQLGNPVDSTETLLGGVGADAFVASSTEPGSSGNVVWDLMIAVPVSSAVTNASILGNYQFAGFDYTGASVSEVRDYAFLAAADGQGNFGALAVTGAAVNLSSNQTVQTVSGATYSASSNTFTMTFPLPSSGTAQSQLITGAKQFGLSSDGMVLVGGSLNGYDIIVGLAAFSGTASNSSFEGVYYAGGMDYAATSPDTPNNYFDAYYGSIGANGAGTALSHQRLNSSISSAYDFYVVDQFTVGADGSVPLDLNLASFYLGANAKTGVLVGLDSPYSFEFWVAAQELAPSGSVYLNPLGITNVASYDPVTSPVSPGEFLILTGTNLAASPSLARSLPLETMLGSTSVSINGVAAPLYYVSPTQIDLIVPFEIAQSSLVQIVVSNGGAASNAVTLYASDTTPGMFTLGQDGIGPGAITHTDGSLVSDANPAQVGETVVLYASGLGLVSPAIADGSEGPAGPLSYTVSPVGVIVGGVQASSVEFAGLAPFYVGLYQIDFVIPAGVNPGELNCDLSTDSGYLAQATIAVGTASMESSAARPDERSPRRNPARASRSRMSQSPHAWQ
jgi:uncharacterized protein (TIGR03437 family)